MARGSARPHMGNLAVRYVDGVLDPLGQRAQPRAKDHAHLEPAVADALAHDARGLGKVLFQHVALGHCCSFKIEDDSYC